MSVSTQILDALVANQQNPIGTVLDNQRDMLSRIVFHALDETDAYKERLAPIVVGDSLDFDEWQKIPVLTRAQAQANPEAYYARSVPDFAGPTQESSTSGSTGLPFVHRRSALMQATSLAQTARGKWWQGAVFSKTQASIGAMHKQTSPYPEGRVVEGWGPANTPGKSASLSVATSTDEQIEWLSRIKPHYLMIYPNVLNEIALNTGDSDWSENLEIIFSYGTLLSPTTIENVRRHIGAHVKVSNFYGSEEVGIIAVSGGSGDEMHTMVESVYVEIVDDEGCQVPEGERGRVVVTSLLNYAMPLIRYDVGDMAIAGTARPTSGLPLPTIRSILGRNRNMFVRPDGSKFNPHIPLDIFDKHLPARQSQVLQHTPVELEVLYVPMDEDQMEDREAFSQRSCECLRGEFSFKFKRLPDVQVGPNGKFEDYKCLVEQ